jgi:hypothetical protein
MAGIRVKMERRKKIKIVKCEEKSPGEVKWRKT